MISRKLRIILVASLFTISTTLTLHFIMAMLLLNKDPSFGYWAVTTWPGTGPLLFLIGFFGLSAFGIRLAIELIPKEKK